MLYKNRILATEGYRNKDGSTQKYDLSKAKFIAPWITWVHPDNNNVMTEDIVGRIYNHQLKEGKLIADMDIWDDRMDPERWNYLEQHPDVSIGYWYTNSGSDDKLVRHIEEINHVAIGIERGVCPSPECGLKTSADTEGKQYDHLTIEGIEMNSKKTGCDEKDAVIEAKDKQIADLQKSLKIAQDSIAAYEVKVKDKLVRSLVRRLGADESKLKEMSLNQLSFLDSNTKDIKIVSGGLDITTEGADDKPNDAKPDLESKVVMGRNSPKAKVS